MRERLKRGGNRTAILFLLSYLVVMIVPLLISIGFSYPRMRRMVIEKSTEQALSNVSQVKNDMDTELLSVLSMPKYVFENKRIILHNLLNDPIARLQAKEDLEQMIKTNTFFSNFFLYLRDSDYFIVPRLGTFYFRDLQQYPGIYQIAFGDWSKDELFDVLENTNDLVIHPVASMTIVGKRYEKMLLFVMPFPSGTHAQATIVLAVAAGRLNTMANAPSPANGNFLFFGDNTTLLHMTAPLAKEDEAAIVDMLTAEKDPSGTREILLSSGNHIIAWSTSLRYGWQYAKIIPMQNIIGQVYALQQATLLVMAGVILLCLVLIYIAMRLNYSPIKRLANLAFVSSPRPPSVKNDLDAIQQLILKLKDDNDQLEKRLDITEPQIREYLIAKILSGNHKEVVSSLAHAEHISLNIQPGPLTVAIASYSDVSQAGRLCEKLKNAVSNETRLIAAQLDTPEQIIVILDGDDAASAEAWLTKHMEGFAYLAIGQTVSLPEEISTSYNTAYATLDYARLKGASGRISRYDDLPERVFNPRSYPLEVMQALESAITHAGSEKVQELVAQIEAMLTLDDAPPYYTRSVYFNAVNLLIGGLLRYLGENNETVQQIGMRSMLSHYTIQEMVNILKATSARLITIIREYTRDYSPYAKALAFIDDNIASPLLGLQMVADYIGMSPSAFSRAFKEKVGKNFKEYVDASRIHQAKALLLESNMPIEQIATSVGYDTVTSFYRMFKKCTGLAPGEFRQAKHM